MSGVSYDGVRIDTSLNQTFVQVLAIIRKYQIETQG